VSGPDDDDVSGHDRRRVQTDVAGDRVEHLIVELLQIDDAVLAESSHRLSGLGFEGCELISNRHEEDSLVATSVGPVRDAAPGKRPRRGGGPLVFVEAVHPQQLAGRRVDGDRVAPGTRRCVEYAVDHKRRRLKVEVGPRAEDVGLEAPCDLKLAEIGAVDLVERRVAGAAEISPVGSPFTVFGSRLALHGRGSPRQREDERNCGTHHASRHRSLRLPQP
jgi:hypothetical protein